MPKTIKIVLEQYTGGTSQPFHAAGQSYKYRQAASLTDAPAKLTPRLAVFYRDLIRMATELGSQELPIDFIDANGDHKAMDLGCVKIAEHAGFLLPLTDGPDGTMKTVRLSFKVT
jgi:hypothetical protein